jgi:hypothetical protein
VLEVFVEEARAEMERQHRSQSWLARRMGTSRSVLKSTLSATPSRCASCDSGPLRRRAG